MNITRNQAICMFYYVDYTEENVKKYKKELEDLGKVEICYNIDPLQPILVTLTRIREDPFSYHRYTTNTSLKKQPYIRF
jgi:C4-dicarboxylate transporter